MFGSGIGGRELGIGSRVSGTGCRESGIERHGAVDEILSSYKAARYVTAEAIGHSRMRLGGGHRDPPNAPGQAGSIWMERAAPAARNVRALIVTLPNASTKRFSTGLPLTSERHTKRKAPARSPRWRFALSVASHS